MMSLKSSGTLHRLGPYQRERLAFIWATTQTCNTQGFFLQLGLAVPMYNDSIGIYYLLVFRFNMQDAMLKRRAEPYMHLFSFSFAGVTAGVCCDWT
mmetsp:Transcript_8088/g.14696  ORF Transcript_8088/g.14696 Transcript_8088/m.14696 type:complete len:96 (-) Transcript_8088:1268-1555(-)